MSDLPHGWAEATLDDIALSVKNGIFVSRPKNDPDGVPILRISSVRSLRLDLSDIRYSAASVASLEDSDALLQEGDLLFTRYNGNPEYVGACARIPLLIEPLTYPDKLIRVRIDDRICDSRFAVFAFAAPAARDQIRSLSRTTAGQIGISGRSLRRVRIPLPSLPEQRRIVATLEDHLSRVDAGGAYLNQASQQESQLRIAIYTAAVEGRLIDSPQAGVPIAERFDAERQSRWWKEHGDRKYKSPVEPDLEIEPFVPDSWHVVSLEAATDPTRLIQYGILMPRVKIKGSVPYVEVKDLAGETLSGKKLNRTSRELDEQFSKSRLAKNDVVMAVRGSYERSAVVPGDLEGANVSRDVVRIAPLADLDPDYLHIYLQSAFSRRYFAHHARGVAVKGVNTASVRSLPVVIPTLEVQHEIVREVRQCISAVNKLSTEISYARKRASNLKKSLLAEAFAGRLVPQDPTDVPAAELLERIRVQGPMAQPRARRGRRTAKQTPQGETLL